MVELQSSSNDRSARAAIERSGLSQKHRKLGRVVEVGMGRRKDLVSHPARRTMNGTFTNLGTAPLMAFFNPRRTRYANLTRRTVSAADDPLELSALPTARTKERTPARCLSQFDRG